MSLQQVCACSSCKAHTSGHTPWVFQRNLQAQFSLARFVTGDRFVFTQSLTSHTTVRQNWKNDTTPKKIYKLVAIYGNFDYFCKKRNQCIDFLVL